MTHPVAHNLALHEVSDPGYPDNAKVQLPVYAEWYGDNQGRMLNQFIDLVSS